MPTVALHVGPTSFLKGPFSTKCGKLAGLQVQGSLRLIFTICSHVEGRRNFFCSWEWRSRPTVFQIFLIYIKVTTLTTFLSKLVQFICYHSVITNNKAMPKENSEFVTLAILKEMLAAQERAYKTTTVACGWYEIWNKIVALWGGWT